MADKKKVALITGAGEGIGKGVALQLAEDGFAIVVTDKDSKRAEDVAKLIADKGGTALAIQCDVSHEAQVKVMFDKVEKECGRLDVYVPNAGIFVPGGTLDLTLEEWNKQMTVNYDSLFLCTPRAIDMIGKHGEGGSIVFSIATDAFKVNPDAAAFTAANWGIRGFFRCISLRVAKQMITVNGVAAGLVKSEMSDQLVAAKAKTDGLGIRQAEKALLDEIPLGRYQPMSEIAKIYSFLAGPESRKITGTIFISSGGTVMV